jgi:hypothetical protein
MSKESCGGSQGGMRRDAKRIDRLESWSGSFGGGLCTQVGHIRAFPSTAGANGADFPIVWPLAPREKKGWKVSGVEGKQQLPARA